MTNEPIKAGGLFRTADGVNLLPAFVLVTSLFFLWGFAHSLLDVLNKHFQETLSVSRTESAYVQAVVYGGYFLMALPAGLLIRRFGYRAVVLLGLGLYGIGALLFIPGGRLLSFPFFLFSLFVIGCGLTCLETAANPYVTVLGDERGAERRINLSQAFNGLGWMVGPLVGGLLLFSADGSGDGSAISLPYAIVGVAVLAVMLVFTRVRLPEIHSGGEATAADAPLKLTEGSMWSRRNFTFGLVALFLYVAAQTGVNSFFINYVTDYSAVSARTASLLLSFGGMGLFMLGRMGGSWLMSRVAPRTVLTIAAIGATAAMGVLLTGAGSAGVGAFFLCYLCESIMFPTIFALAIRGMGAHTETASSLLIMCIVGGAVAPVLMGHIADTRGAMAPAFLVPLVCFAVIAVYAHWFSKQ